MADVNVGLGVDLADVAKALARIPAMTSEESEKAVRQMTRAFDKAATESKKLSATVGRANQKASKDTQEGLKGLYELAGGSGDRIEKLGKAVGALGTPIGAMAIAAGASALALGGVVAGITSAVFASDELLDSLEPYDKLGAWAGISPAAAESIRQANAAVEGMGVLLDEAVLTLGAEFAPAVEEATRALLTLGFVALDAWKAFASGEDVLREVAVFAGDYLVRALLGSADSIMTIVSALGALAEVTGSTGLADTLQGITDRYEELRRGVVESGVDAALGGVTSAFDALGDAGAGYGERVDALLARVRELNDEHGKGKGKVEDLTKALLAEAHAAQAAADAFAARLATVEASAAQADALVAASGDWARGEIGKLSDARDAAVQKYVETARAGALAEADIEAGKAEIVAQYEAQITDKLVAEQDKRIQAATDASEKAADAARAYAQSVAGDVASVFGTVASVISQGYSEAASQVGDLQSQLEQGGEDLTASERAQLRARIEAQKDAATEAWMAQQAAALAQAAVLAIQAEMQAASSAPWPYNLPAIAVATAAAAASIGGIASAKPPKFHSGRAPDEMPATLTRHEAVLTSQGVAAAGGSQAVRAMNEGRGSGSSDGAATVVIDHRTMGRSVQRLLRRGPMAAAVRQGKRVGHSGRS